MLKKFPYVPAPVLIVPDAVKSLDDVCRLVSD